MEYRMKNSISALALMSSAFLLSGCGSSSSSDSGVAVSIPFKAMAGSQAIRCGETITGLGTAGTDVKIANFRMFVHDIKLMTDQNIEIPVKLDATQESQNAEVALLDFRDTADIGEVLTEICPQDTTGDTVANPSYNDVITGSATIDSAYTISAIQFTLGVPFNLNHKDQAAAIEPLRQPGLASGMTWDWQGGYKFVGFDVLPIGGITRPLDNEWSSPKWNIHIGSTGCSVTKTELESGTQPESCLAPNLVEVTLPIGAYNLDEIAIQIDYAQLVSGNNLSIDEGVKAGCMSFVTDPECAGVFEKLGLPWEENEATEQSIFSIVDISENINEPI